jgi:hypothetical protein
MKSEGEKLRDEGCAQVVNYEPAEWKLLYEQLAVEFMDTMNNGDTFLGEDLTAVVRSAIGEPHHPNLWGAMFMKMYHAWVKSGTITRLDMARAKSPANHASLYPTYMVTKRETPCQ